MSGFTAFPVHYLYLKLNKQIDLGPFTLHPHIVSVFQKVPAMHNTDPIVTCALGSHHSVFLHHSGWIIGLCLNKKRQPAALCDTSGIISNVQCAWNETYISHTSESRWRTEPRPPRVGDLGYRWWRQRTTWLQLSGFLDTFESGQVRSVLWAQCPDSHRINWCLYISQC